MPAPNFKQKPFRSAKYRRWISSLDCCISRRPGPSDPHHVKTPGNAGMGTKVGDDRCVPLARWLHMEVERGESAFWMKWGVDPEQLIKDLNAEWVRMGNRIG